MARLDLCVRDGAVRRNSKVNDDGAADVHAAGEFRVDRRNFADDGAVRAGGVSETGAQSESAQKEKMKR
jgi:hypothetical protein